MSTVVIPGKQAELEKLLDSFFQGYVGAEEGKHHISLYEDGRQTGQKHYEELLQATGRDEDVTDDVLLYLLPHADTVGNRERGAWVHVAPAVTKDIKSWFEGAGWTSPDDWPRISQAIFSFIRRCIESPDQLADACAEFSELSYSKGFQSGMLSPILNAIGPEDFLLINNKSRTVINYFCGTDHRSSLEDYPSAIKSAQQVVESVRPAIAEHKGTDNLYDADYLDMFYHWLVAVKKYSLTEPKYWKIAPGQDGENWEQCREDGYISIGWSELGDLSGVSRDEYETLRDKVVAESPTRTKQGTDQAWRFSHIKEGDRIVANKGTGEILGFGTVSGSYYFTEGADHGHRLPVQWDDITPRVIEQSGWRRTLIKLDRDKFEMLLTAPGTGVSSNSTGKNLVYSLTMLADETGMDEELLQRWVNAIERKGQAVLYGPPGTGKTFLAEHLAKHLIGGGDGLTETVQFHPAYAYEDFIQGIRPHTGDDGTLRYPVVPGRFLDFCGKASTRQGRCVLIVDEINRANLSRVFGELMYLLEYRNRSVPLAGGGELTIPQNVRLVGTMNTADRSIALVDHALRRRFAFLALYPDYRLLAAFHEKSTGLDVAGLTGVLQELNKAIGDRHYEVGITYFLRQDLDEQIEDIWRMEIEPYLEEYFFDQHEKVNQHRWDAIKESLAF